MPADDTLHSVPLVRPDAETLPLAAASPPPPVRPDADTLDAEPAPPAPPTEVAPGQAQLLGAATLDALEAPPYLSPYAIGGLLGRGGTGSVYEAIERATGARVALKILAPQLAQIPEARERFLREARSAARLDHPGIVRIRAAGEEAGVHFIAFDRVAGRSLGRLLEGESVPPDRAARWGRDLADALAHAHGRGVLHRDVKPANILVTAEWKVLLLDFGLARPADASRLTGTNDILGTPGYMSPEQLECRPTDERTDVYGLGATLFAMLAGRPPYPSFDLLLHRSSLLAGERPEMPAGVTPPLAAIIGTCLELEPERRYPGMEALRDDLDRFLDGRPVWAEGRPRSGRRRLPIVAAIASLVVLGVFLAWRTAHHKEVPATHPPIAAGDPIVELRGTGEASLYDFRDRAVTDLGAPRWKGVLPASVPLPAGSWLIEGACRVTFVTPCEGAVEVPSARAPEGYVVVAVHGRRPFLIGRTEATTGAYRKFLASLSPSEKLERTPRNEKGHAILHVQDADDLPVHGISWDDARAFADWSIARLPTMDEWELACRGADGRPYPWGRGIDRRRADFTNNTADLYIDRVGMKPDGEAPCGALDMHGNVAEWVDDGNATGVRYARGWTRTGDPERWCGYDMESSPKGTPSVQMGVRLARDLR